MSESNQIIETVRALDLPSDQYAVFGSGLMDVLDLRESKMPFCSQAEIEGKIRRAITIDGMKFVQLSDTLAWKKALGREKDIEDVKIIEDYIDKQEKEETR